MFSADGFFQFVFANRNDHYYTQSLVKLNFESYILYTLKKCKFKYIVFLTKCDSTSEYILEVTGINLDTLFEQKNKKDSVSIRRLIGGRKTVSDASPFEPSIKRKKTEKMTLDKAIPFIDKILELMQENEGISLVMSIDDFFAYSKNEKKCKLLSSLKRKQSYNCVVLVSSVEASENDRFFTSSANDNVFFDGRLFPEIREAFDSVNHPERVKKLVFTYEILKSALGDRMHVLNMFSEESVLNVVKYSLLRVTHYNTVNIMFTPEFVTAAIRIWYGNKNFRSKYQDNSPFVDIPNENRMFSEIELCVPKIKFFQWLQNVSREEETEDGKKLTDKWIINDDYQYIGYFSSSFNPHAITVKIKNFQRMLISCNYKLGNDKLGNNKYERLTAIVECFQKPSQKSSLLKTELPHKLFEEKDCANLVDNLISNLSRKSEWNSWDDGCVEILYTLFDLCYEHADDAGDVDTFNEIGKLQIKKGMEMIEFAMQQSIVAPFANDYACRVTAKTEQMLREGTMKELKKMSFSNEELALSKGYL